MSPWLIAFATIVAAILINRLLKLLSGPSLPLPPGPRPWPIVGNLPHMGPAPHQGLAALAQTYGPLMHLQLGIAHVVVAASGTVAEQFLKVHDANFCSRPLNFRTKYMTYDVKDLIFAPYGPRWRFLRKISTVHMFSGKALDDFCQLRQEEVKRLIHNLAISKSKAVNLGRLLNICTTNTMSKIMIGRRLFNDYGSYDTKADEFRSIVGDLMALLGVFNIGDFVPILDWLDLQGVKPKTKNLHKRLDAFLTTILEEHIISKNEQDKNFLSALLSHKETHQEGDEVLEHEIKAIFADILIAGTDTSSSTIEWAIAELIKNPKIMVKVQQELNIVVGQDRLVTELDLPHLPYLQAVVKETLRLHPEEACEIFGYHIPKGATLLVNIWAIGRDPKEWIDPLEFKPERFLPGSEKVDVDVKGNNFEVIPFGAGRRICVGVSLGLKVVQLLVATLAHAFDWELENGLDPKKLNMDEAYGLTLQRAVPLSVHPHPRLSQHVYSSLTQKSLEISLRANEVYDAQVGELQEIANSSRDRVRSLEDEVSGLRADLAEVAERRLCDEVLLAGKEEEASALKADLDQLAAMKAALEMRLVETERAALLEHKKGFVKAAHQARLLAPGVDLSAMHVEKEVRAGRLV
uniref:Flavonoid 3'-monooxygenase n=1 Tax=Cajanus cajan TaxID=3821 RepID=A0A151RDL6_CAJCA|nr:Flavonoid 3'-monooxygenase [Cajanus cajan]